MAWAEWSLDWSTALVLAAVTVLDGFRRVPSGATIVSRVLAGPWIRERETSAGGLGLVSWGSPFVLHLLFPPAERARVPADLRRRWRRARTWLPLLRAVATLQWLLLVAGIPLAMARWGSLGLLLAIVIVLQGALLLVILSACSLDAVGVRKPEIIRAVRGLLSPFAAPRAAEIVSEAALAGTPPLEALRLLLPASAYRTLLRPLAYDVKHRGLDPALLADVPSREIDTALSRRPAGSDGAPFCPRCGGTYRPPTNSCDDCDGISLIQ